MAAVSADISISISNENLRRLGDEAREQRRTVRQLLEIIVEKAVDLDPLMEGIAAAREAELYESG